MVFGLPFLMHLLELGQKPATHDINTNVFIILNGDVFSVCPSKILLRHNFAKKRMLSSLHILVCDWPFDPSIFPNLRLFNIFICLKSLEFG